MPRLSPTDCQVDPSYRDTWTTTECQQTQDLHRLVEFTVPATCIIALLLGCLVAMQLRARGGDAL